MVQDLADMPDPTVVVDGVPVVPEPLRATDGGFTEDSVRRRLPCIVESILEHNNTYSAELVHALRHARHVCFLPRD